MTALGHLQRTLSIVDDVASCGAPAVRTADERLIDVRCSTTQLTLVVEATTAGRQLATQLTENLEQLDWDVVERRVIERPTDDPCRRRVLVFQHTTEQPTTQ